MSSTPFTGTLPVCVDLDHTLIHTDSLWILLRGVMQYPHLWQEIFWPFSRSHMKHKLAQYVRFCPKRLRYHKTLLEDIRTWRKEGRQVLLVTGAPEKIAAQVAHHMAIFTQSVGSTQHLNLSGKIKGQYLKTLFGENKFLYIGDSWKDLFVWRWAAGIGIVSRSRVLVWCLRLLKRPHQELKIYAGGLSHYVYS